MADLAIALSKIGYKVTYVAQRPMSDERSAQGWVPPILTDVTLQLAGSDEVAREIVRNASIDSLHICQGVRANGMIRAAQDALKIRDLPQWVVMETVDDSGWRGILKRIEYARIFRSRQRSLQGILATGHRTVDWISARGIKKDKIFPFSYFLPVSEENHYPKPREAGPYRLLFAGRLIKLKRIDWLINSLANLKEEAFELWILGAGPDEAELRLLAERKLGEKVRWLGQLPLPEVPAIMAQADCLVLPSVHDGWGAVASEALMVGTPVVCSDSCGVAGVVRKSKYGGVFTTKNFDELTHLLSTQIAKGPVDSSLRKKIIDWSMCLSADSGALYLHEILNFSQNRITQCPQAPWNKRLIEHE